MEYGNLTIEQIAQALPEFQVEPPPNTTYELPNVLWFKESGLFVVQVRKTIQLELGAEISEYYRSLEVVDEDELENPVLCTHDIGYATELEAVLGALARRYVGWGTNIDTVLLKLLS